MYKSLAIFTGCLIVFNLSACSDAKQSGNTDGQSSSSDYSSPPKLSWPHSRHLSAKEEEEFNTDFTTLNGSFKEFYDGPDQSRILINENDISFVISGESFKHFDKESFLSKIAARSDAPITFLVGHLEAEQPHADKETGKLFMNVQGIIVGNDNLDLIKSQK